MQRDRLRACSPLTDSPSYCCAAGLMLRTHMDLLSRTHLCFFLAAECISVCMCVYAHVGALNTLTVLIKGPALLT